MRAELHRQSGCGLGGAFVSSCCGLVKELVVQVNPPFRDDEPACAASFLWWQQTMTPRETLWDLARSCTENIRRESDQYGGLTFWARLHASKTLAELATAPTPPYSPPYSVRPLSLF